MIFLACTAIPSAPARCTAPTTRPQGDMLRTHLDLVLRGLEAGAPSTAAEPPHGRLMRWLARAAGGRAWPARWVRRWRLPGRARPARRQPRGGRRPPRPPAAAPSNWRRRRGRACAPNSWRTLPVSRRPEGRQQRRREGQGGGRAARADRARRRPRASAGQLIGGWTPPNSSWRLRQAEDQAAAAQAQLDIAERTLANNRRWSTRASSRATRSTPRSATPPRARIAAGGAAAAELARKAVRDTEVRAPLSGLVSQRLVQPGERVARGRAHRRDRRPLAHRARSRHRARRRAGAARRPDGAAAGGRPGRAGGRARGAHQPQHAGRHARGDGLPGARAPRPARPAPGPVRARHGRPAAAARRWWCRPRRCASTRRAPMCWCRRRPRAARVSWARAARRFGGAPEPAVEVAAAWPTARACCAAASARCATARALIGCGEPAGGSRRRRPASGARALTRRCKARDPRHVVHPRLHRQPGDGHDGHAGLRGAGPVQLPAAAIDQFPNIDVPTVVVQMDYPGASPEIVEAEVTKKIEEAVNTVAGISAVLALLRGQAVVIVEFNLDVDGRKAAEDVREKVALMRPLLRDEVKDPRISASTPPASRSSTSRCCRPTAAGAPQELTTWATQVLQKRLENVRGVGAVTRGGRRGARDQHLPCGRRRWRPGRQRRAGGGRAAQREPGAAAGRHPLARAGARGADQRAAEDAGGFPRHRRRARRNGCPSSSWQVADVVDGPQEVESLALYNGQRTVLLSVQKSQGENTIAVVDGLQEGAGRRPQAAARRA
jgi:hypothetical protein